MRANWSDWYRYSIVVQNNNVILCIVSLIFLLVPTLLFLSEPIEFKRLSFCKIEFPMAGRTAIITRIDCIVEMTYYFKFVATNNIVLFDSPDVYVIDVQILLSRQLSRIKKRFVWRRTKQGLFSRRIQLQW